MSVRTEGQGSSGPPPVFCPCVLPLCSPRFARFKPQPVVLVEFASLKIACIIHSLDGGGAERVIASLATRLGDRGHEVALITLDDGKNDRHEVGTAVRRVTLDVMASAPSSLFSKLTNRRRRLAAIKRAVENESPDVVLSFCDRTNIDVLSALKRASYPVVVSERSDPDQQSLGWFWQFMRRRTYRNRQVIALTDTAAAHLQPFCRQKVTVIPSAVDQPPLISDRSTAAQNRLIIGIGRLEKEKGFDRLLEVFYKVTQQHQRWQLRILGEGSLRADLEKLATDLGIADRVQLPGWVRPVWGELAAATLFVLPSRYEGFPSALLEAMVTGVPSVAVDCESGPRAIIDNESNGLLVGNTISDLTIGVHRLIENAELRERLGVEGRKVGERFGWDAMVDQYEEVLKKAR